MKTLPTVADIRLSAQAAANAAAALTSPLDLQTSKLKSFAESGFHPDDFPNWENEFNLQLETQANYARQLSVASKAGKLPTTAS